MKTSEETNKILREIRTWLMVIFVALLGIIVTQ